MKEKTFSEEVSAVRDMISTLCASTYCIACYDCGHKNKLSVTLQKHGTNDTCPLAKYNMSPRQHSEEQFAELMKNPMGEEKLRQLNIICACCDNTSVTSLNEGSLTVETTENTRQNICVDCPVNLCRQYANYHKKKAEESVEKN